MTTNLFFATSNNGKFEEVSRIIKKTHPHIKLIRIKDELQEIQGTPEEIVEWKLRISMSRHQYLTPVIVEDSSLYFERFNYKLPGPYIKHFLDAIGLEDLSMLETSDQCRARAECHIGYCDNNNKITFYKGITEGRIYTPSGDNGFGWDSIFCPFVEDLKERSYAEITSDQKDSCSDRGKAIKALLDSKYIL